VSKALEIKNGILPRLEETARSVFELGGIHGNSKYLHWALHRALWADIKKLQELSDRMMKEENAPTPDQEAG
jgi:hypothetical protein